MTQLTLHGHNVSTVFDLLGSSENAMTKSLGWALSRCDVFCQQLADMLGFHQGFSDAVVIRLQEHESEKGFTDIEIIDQGRVHIVIEAKRGFDIPSCDQLEKYADRLLASDTRAEKLLLVLAESDREEQWLSRHVPDCVKGVEVRAISWKQFQDMAKDSVSKTTKPYEKGLLRQFIRYLEKVTTMQNQTSNYVYVVPLNSNVVFEEVGTSFIDVVVKHQKYFHPIGNHFPIEPPNYIAFRYRGILQSIHHIESYKIIEDFQEDFNLPSLCKTDGKLYLYELGPAIRPAREVTTNDGVNQRIFGPGSNWCFIDLLLTCGSVAEAVAKTIERSRE